MYYCQSQLVCDWPRDTIFSLPVKPLNVQLFTLPYDHPRWQTDKRNVASHCAVVFEATVFFFKYRIIDCLQEMLYYHTERKTCFTLTTNVNLWCNVWTNRTPFMIWKTRAISEMLKKAFSIYRLFIQSDVQMRKHHRQHTRPLGQSFCVALIYFYMQFINLHIAHYI